MIAPILAAAVTFVCINPGIIDGDTVACQWGPHVRIWGIQAPERSDPGGPASTRALAQIINGNSLVCEKRGKSYNRVVAQCFIGATDVDPAAEMVRQGQAVDWQKYSHGAYAR